MYGQRLRSDSVIIDQRARSNILFELQQIKRQLCYNRSIKLQQIKGQGQIVYLKYNRSKVNVRYSN